MPIVSEYQVNEGEFVDPITSTTETGMLARITLIMSLADLELLKAGDAATLARLVELLANHMPEQL